MNGTVSECDLCVVHNVDANAWREYIMQLVRRFVTRKGAAPLGIESVVDTSLTKTGYSLPQSAIIIVILSPAHLEFLRCHHNVNYRTLVDTRATNALVLRCGVDCFGDLADQDKTIFSQFFGWTKLEDIDNGEPVIKAVGRLLTRRPSQDEDLYVNPDEVIDSRRSSTSTSRPHSSTSDSPSNRSSSRSSGGWPAVPNMELTEASTAPHFQVIPTTIRCEVRSPNIGLLKP